MKIEILGECGYEYALLGLSLSYNQPTGKMPGVANKLADKDMAHNKFLESIVVWLDITAMRGWWQQESTYRVGISRQSESTMHTILKRELTQDNFEQPIYPAILDRLNELIRTKDFDQLKIELPEGFLQRRIVCLNYKALRNIINQRKTHKLKGWQQFCEYILSNVEHPEFLR